MAPRERWNNDDVRRCLEGRCIGVNCPCLCHMKPPIPHRAMRMAPRDSLERERRSKPGKK